MGDEEGSLRLEAVHEAVAFYRDKYADQHSEPFQLHDRVSFRHDRERGVHLVATGDVQAQETIIAWS